MCYGPTFPQIRSRLRRLSDLKRVSSVKSYPRISPLLSMMPQKIFAQQFSPLSLIIYWPGCPPSSIMFVVVNFCVRCYPEIQSNSPARSSSRLFSVLKHSRMSFTSTPLLCSAIMAPLLSVQIWIFPRP